MKLHAGWIGKNMEDNRKREKIELVLKLLAAVLALLSLFFASGCGSSTDKSEVENVVPKAGTVQLYHPTETTVEPDEGVYQLMQPDNLAASIEEVLERIQINNKLVVNKYTIDIIDEKKNVTLYISETDDLTAEELLLNKAAIVKSIEGIGVDEVALEFSTASGKVIEKATYTDASFVYYDE